jgi:hypothetical protein
MSMLEDTSASMFGKGAGADPNGGATKGIPDTGGTDPAKDRAAKAGDMARAKRITGGGPKPARLKKLEVKSYR